MGTKWLLQKIKISSLELAANFFSEMTTAQVVDPLCTIINWNARFA
jgi:hypothetical protein